MVRRWLVLVVGAVLTVSVAARGDGPVISRWRTDDIRVDGVMSDWTALTFVTKEVAMAVANDREHLYLVVSTSDPAVRGTIMRAGLTVYVDPKGKKGQAFGLRVPPLGSRLAPGSTPPSHGGAPLLSYFDVMGPSDDDVQRVQADEPMGLELMVGTHQGTFFVEMKVPFTRGDGRPYAPGVELARGPIGLGIVTPEPPRQARPEGRAGRGGRGGMSGGGAGGRRPGGRAGVAGKAVKVWTTVVLARES